MYSKRSKGFTLIEVLVAAVVAGICFVGLYAAATQCLKQIWSAREASRAAQVENCESEFLRTTAWSNITAKGSSYTISASDNPALPLLNNGAGTVDLAPINGDTNLLQATITLTWTGYQGNRDKSMTSAIIITKYGFLR